MVWLLDTVTINFPIMFYYQCPSRTTLAVHATFITLLVSLVWLFEKFYAASQDRVEALEQYVAKDVADKIRRTTRPDWHVYIAATALVAVIVLVLFSGYSDNSYVCLLALLQQKPQ